MNSRKGAGSFPEFRFGLSLLKSGPQGQQPVFLDSQVAFSFCSVTVAIGFWMVLSAKGKANNKRRTRRPRELLLGKSTQEVRRVPELGFLGQRCDRLAKWGAKRVRQSPRRALLRCSTPPIHKNYLRGWPSCDRCFQSQLRTFLGVFSAWKETITSGDPGGFGAMSLNLPAFCKIDPLMRAVGFPWSLLVPKGDHRFGPGPSRLSQQNVWAEGRGFLLRIPDT